MAVTKFIFFYYEYSAAASFCQFLFHGKFPHFTSSPLELVFTIFYLVYNRFFSDFVSIQIKSFSSNRKTKKVTYTSLYWNIPYCMDSTYKQFMEYVALLTG